MNKMILLMVGAVALTGCVTTTCDEAPCQIAPVPVEERVEAPVEAPAEEPVEAPKAEPVAEETVQQVSPAPARPAGHVTTIEKPLRVLVSLTDGNPDDNPTTCKRCLQANIEGELARSGYKVVYMKPAETLVYGTLRGGELNSRGSRVVWQVTAEMGVICAPETVTVNGQTMSDIFAKQRFEIQSGDARTPSLAQKQCADRLSDDVSAFTKDALDKIAKKIKVCEITVADACDKDDAKAYADKLAETLGNLSGVYGCKIVSTGKAEAVVKAEIVYEASSFPEGVVARLLPIAALNIAP